MKQDNIIIDFAQFPFCFRSISIKNKFTNKLKDNIQFFEFFSEIFEKNIPFLINYTFENVAYASKHSHVIPLDSKQYTIIKEILKQLCKEFYKFDDCDFEMWFNQNINEYRIWQLGATGGVRLIGVRKMNTFCVLFIDYHHQLYPSTKHNHVNVDKFEFCPITNFKKEQVI